MDKLILDEQLCLFETELTAANHTVETDFAVKIYLSAATFWTVYILILRLKHCRIGPFSGYRVLLITIHDVLSAIFGPNKSWPVHPSPKTRVLLCTQTSILLDQHRKADLQRLSDLKKNMCFVNEILRLAETRRLSAAELADLQDRLSQIYAEGYPTMNMEGEKLFVMDVIQRSFTDGGPGGGHLIPQRWREYADAPPGLVESQLRLLTPIHTAAGMVHAGRNATVALANELYDRQIALAKKTPYQRQASGLKMPMETLFSLPRYRFFLIRHLLPASGRIYELAYRSKMHYESTVTILAIERWRLEKNQYLEEFSELVAIGFVKELPIDPFSDKPLVYRRTDDDFILYSFGPNFRDDGGQMAIVRGREMKWGTRDAGDIILWPPLKHRRL